MSIIKFIRRSGDFDDQATRLMGEAFDQACAGTGVLTDNIREIIALRIIEAARKGERNIDALRQAGLVTIEFEMKRL